MKKHIFLSCLITTSMLLTQPAILPVTAEAPAASVLEMTDIFAQQNAIDEALLAEAGNGYTFEEPSVILNPYGNSPLTAVIVFSTEESVGGTITVKGKSPENDITGTFASAKDHIVPVYGLYNGDTTTVELTLDNKASTSIEVTTEAVDPGVGEITMDMKDASVYDYNKLTILCSLAGKMYATDAAGDIRWLLTGVGNMGAHQLANGHLMVPSSFVLRQMYYRSGLLEIDLSGKVYREYAVPGGMHHDFQELPNGNFLIAGDSPDLSSVEDYIVEIDRESGDVVWELDMKDLLDTKDGASVSTFMDGSEEIDWYHNNAVWYDEANDLVLMSARHKDAIVAVSKSDKTLAWILGDPNGWEKADPSLFFTPVGEDFEWQYAQHQVTMLDNGDIMMFDNGSYKVKDPDDPNRATGDDVYSRAVIYRINTEDMTVEQVFEYGKERGEEWYSDWVSGVVSLDGTMDNLVVTAGSHLYSPEEDSHDFGPTGMMKPGLIKSTHVDRLVNGELISELVVSGESFGALTYRSVPMSLYNEGADLDVTAAPELLGNLGETPAADVDISLENAAPLPFEGFTFTLDPMKLSFKGTYQTETAADTLTPGYLVLKNESGTNAYPLTQNGTAGDNGTNVSVSGWTSVTGLAGSYDIYLVLDNAVYHTGYTMEI